MSDNIAVNFQVISGLSSTSEPQWYNGLEGSARQDYISANSVILTILVVLFVSISLNFRKCRKLFTRFFEELRNNKNHENVFDERSSNDSKIATLTTIQYLVYSGIILYGIYTYIRGISLNESDSFMIVMTMIGISAAYYMFQLLLYSIVGFTFAGKEGCIRWLKTLNASLSLSGAAIVIPALVMLFYPTSAVVMVLIAVLLYAISRLWFISKWFSIFYTNFWSLLYFILYLCTLEIIPLFIIYKLALLDS